MNHDLLYQWTEEIASRLPSMNSWQVANMALFSYGIIGSQQCQQQSLARYTASGEQVESNARRLRRFLNNDNLDLKTFFKEWTRWVTGAMDSQTLTVVVDETKIGQRVATMLVGVAWEGRCIPLAWRCYRANSAADYPEEGQVEMIATLLGQVKAGIAPHKKVLVLADRGIGTSPDLCRKVEALGWTYLFRITKQSKICTESGDLTIAAMVQPGEVWAASGKVFKQRGRLEAHARALWSLGYDEPWALVTNDQQVTGHQYAQRNWQEQGFRDLKSLGWHWGESKIRHPDHMERLLILLALAYAWVFAIASYAVADERTQPLIRNPNGSLRRHWSLFKEGLRFFFEVVQRKTVCLKLLFVPDKRFT